MAKVRVLSVLVACMLIAPVPASAGSPPDAGRPFEATPLSEALFDVQPPDADPALQQHRVTAADGVQLYVETWLPKARLDGPPLPERIPTVVNMTPYAAAGEYEYSRRLPDFYFVRRGYAFAQMHLRGTGESGGCFALAADVDADDGARVVEYLGRDAPWSNGAVGAFGLSHNGGAAVLTAALGDPAQTSYLKAIAPLAPTVSEYEFTHFDGVEYFLYPESRHTYSWGHITFESSDDPRAIAARPGCWPEHLSATQTTGDVSDYYRARDARPGAANIRAATFMAHGHSDTRVWPVVQAGLFERIPAATPKAGLFGIFGHEAPSDLSDSNLDPSWARVDYQSMLLAWFDRYLKGLPTGVEEWPVAQVQGNDGQWRAEPDWPTTGGPVGHLALGPGRALGHPSPSGMSAFSEGLFETTVAEPAPGAFVEFDTQPLPERLEITGQPVLDVWVSVDQPDAHLAARLETFDSHGRRLGQQVVDDEGDLIDTGAVMGFRSLQHLDPLVDNRFWQSEGKPAPVGTPIRFQLRFQPTDLVIPAGGSLRLTIAGTLRVKSGLEGAAAAITDELAPSLPTVVGGPSAPSTAFANVTILHDCEHVSALRFLMPRENPDLLNVREADEPADEPLPAVPVAGPVVSDAGGLATAPVCGQAPIRLPSFGPEQTPSGGAS